MARGSYSCVRCDCRWGLKGKKGGGEELGEGDGAEIGFGDTNGGKDVSFVE